MISKKMIPKGNCGEYHPRFFNTAALSFVRRMYVVAAVGFLGRLNLKLDDRFIRIDLDEERLDRVEVQIATSGRVGSHPTYVSV